MPQQQLHTHTRAQADTDRHTAAVTQPIERVLITANPLEIAPVAAVVVLDLSPSILCTLH